jgi:hypothetical protein
MGESSQYVFCFATRKQTRTYERIPRSSAQTDTIVADTQAAHAVLVAAQRANLIATQNIPHLQSQSVTILSKCDQIGNTYLALEIVVTSKQ